MHRMRSTSLLVLALAALRGTELARHRLAHLPRAFLQRLDGALLGVGCGAVLALAEARGGFAHRLIRLPIMANATAPYA